MHTPKLSTIYANLKSRLTFGPLSIIWKSLAYSIFYVFKYDFFYFFFIVKSVYLVSATSINS